MSINKTFWFSKGNKGINVGFYPQHFRKIMRYNNGAVKGIDSCYDCGIWFLGIHLSYTNFNYKP